MGYGLLRGLWVWRRKTNRRPCRPPMSNPLTFPRTAWPCCNLSGGVALIVWFTTNGMCVKNNTTTYVARASNSKRDCYVVALPILTCERLNVTTSVRKERLRAWSLLLLAATVRSFAHMPLGISDRDSLTVLDDETTEWLLNICPEI